MATMKDIAKETGLSLATISKYMNGGNLLEGNRLKIDSAVEKLDYKINYFARGLKTNRSMTIGVLLPTIASAFFASIMEAMDETFQSRGYNCVIATYNFDSKLEREKLHYFVSNNVDAIVLVPEQIEGDELEKIVGDIPLVLLDRMVTGGSFDMVVSDNLNAIYTAMERLVAKNHRRIGIIVGPQTISTAYERMVGYRRIYQDYQLELDENLIAVGDYDVESGHRLFMELMSCPNPPTAICVTNYDMTVGAVTAAHAMGIQLPNQVDFIGFDNIDLCAVTSPPLEIVEQPVTQLGTAVAERILARLDGDESAPQLLRLKCKITCFEPLHF
ncbi:MAG: LacI family DNA-binding transcriptional regulator [Eubacteriales bacterium]